MQSGGGIDSAGRSEATRVFALYRELAVERFGDDLDRIVLFGSRARRENHQDSDWDVAVFLKRAITAADQRGASEVGHDVMCETGALIQSIALPAARWHAGDELIRNIRRDGVPIYE
jgi:predicted nucleotidyltransferase